MNHSAVLNVFSDTWAVEVAKRVGAIDLDPVLMTTTLHPTPETSPNGGFVDFLTLKPYVFNTVEHYLLKPLNDGFAPNHPEEGRG